jgi:type I restriction enzyme R subunit
MTPEEMARQDIDRQLAACGWQVQNRSELNLSAALGIAVRDFPRLTGEADYLLYAGGKAIGAVEAKPKGHSLIGVETQSTKYAGTLPPEIPAYARPLPSPTAVVRSHATLSCSGSMLDSDEDHGKRLSNSACWTPQ